MKTLKWLQSYFHQTNVSLPPLLNIQYTASLAGGEVEQEANCGDGRILGALSVSCITKPQPATLYNPVTPGPGQICLQYFTKKIYDEQGSLSIVLA